MSCSEQKIVSVPLRKRHSLPKGATSASVLIQTQASAAIVTA